MLPLKTLIPLAWEGYQHRFIHADGRVIRPFNQDDTVSEGQAYALLMAVALDDKATFDRVLNWTTNHLSRFEKFGDHLLAWHWGKDTGVTDWNSAADAEVDVALALLLAHARWEDEIYREQAFLLLKDILDLETEVIGDERYLMPGNWRLGNKIHLLNPSYFSPAHFRLFYKVTGDERWKELLRSTYTFLHRLPLQETFSVRAGLVPDWIGIDPEGNLKTAEGFSQHVTWDAVRMPWRVALDVLWRQEPCGRGTIPGLEHIRSITDFLAQEWDEREGKFFLEYGLEGEPIKSEEQVGAYAMALPALQSLQSSLTTGVMNKVKAFFYEEGQYFQHAQDYYQNSLSLLGLLSLQSASTQDMPSLVHELQKYTQNDIILCASRTNSLR